MSFYSRSFTRKGLLPCKVCEIWRNSSSKRHTRFFISNAFRSNTRLKLAKNLARPKQHLEAEISTKMSQKKVCLFQCDYMTNFNENENEKKLT